MLRSLLAAAMLAAVAAPAAAHAQFGTIRNPPAFNPQMDYDGYVALIQEVRPYRQSRLLDWAAFAAAAREPDVLILDARSERQFAAGHIAGAVNLPLTEFSDEALAEVVGRTDRPILIYCNNNFRNDRPPVILKTGRLAINLSTFAHLYGYGYRNVRELGETVDMNDPRIRWVSGPDAAGTTPRAAPAR